MHALVTFFLTLFATTALGATATRSLNITPVITADAYAQGDQIGPLTKLSGALPCSGCAIKLETLTIIDKSKTKDAFDVLFFSTEVTPAADNAANSFSDADMAAGFAGRVAVAAADFVDDGANSYATLKPALMLPGAAGSGHLWMTLVCTDAGGCDWSAVGDLVFRLTYVE